ncbi:hypothetical protein GCM10027277_19940 [Pseudoduganella ginsengisoli]|uniref:DGQHR domain-containing protein n=1 Tax=Pseudoduganella ginsengisoli TaxID=1462440 RepID=A0A6L6PU41_9BURK|nr:hypothetical protein [Pseudoduganella ginsengisoli]MTW00751.1 hypothetical protein [Pseudoduganella ginsengisoli]
MKLTILDEKNEADAICYLCKIDLISYVNSIPTTYREFDVQRGIVSNKYLDHLAETINKKRHIPSIVLVTDEVSITKSTSNRFLKIDDYRILDGLQRTHRLKIIWDIVGFLVNAIDKSVALNNPSKFTRSNSANIKSLGGDVKLVRNLIELGCAELETQEEFFDENTLWIEVWTNLGRSEQVEKMLLLNAGHKSVNIKHQLELLFLNMLFRLEDIAPDGVSFIREKEQSAIQYSKSRNVGEYHFAHVISALIALSAGKIVNTNSDLVSDMQSNQNDYIDLIEGFNLRLIKTFVEFLFSLDKSLNSVYGDVGVKWLGREVVLIGMFGAIGDFSEEQPEALVKVFSRLELQLHSLVKSLQLASFEQERNKVELNKVNVGNVNKRAVFKAVHDLLRGIKFQGWKTYFGGN